MTNQDGTVTYISYLNIHIDTYVRLILITNTAYIFRCRHCTTHAGSKCSQTVYLCLLTSRIFFTCLPTSNLNNIISYLFSHKATLMYKILRAYFTKLNGININYNLRNLETDLALPRPRTNFLKRSFKYSTRQK